MPSELCRARLAGRYTVRVRARGARLELEHLWQRRSRRGRPPAFPRAGAPEPAGRMATARARAGAAMALAARYWHRRARHALVCRRRREAGHVGEALIAAEGFG
jgi:hypothetical protein